MMARIKKLIRQSPTIYNTVAMSVGPYLRFLYFKRFIKQRLSSDEIHILDAGFGRGEHLLWLEQSLPNATLLGYDLAETSTYLSNFDIAKSRLQRSNLQKVDLLKMQDDSCFDLVFSIDVLEHIRNNETVIANFYRAIKSGGYLYLAMPYEDPDGGYILPESWLEYLTDWAEDEHIGEMRSVEEMDALLQKIGFLVLDRQYTYTMPVRFLWEIQQLLRKLPATHFLNPIFNVLAHIEFMLPNPKTGSIRFIARKP